MLVHGTKKGKALHLAGGDRLELVRKSWMDTKRNQNRSDAGDPKPGPRQGKARQGRQEQKQAKLEQEQMQEEQRAAGAGVGEARRS